MEKEKMMNEIVRLKKIIKAYERFEGDVEYALHKVQNDRVEDALEALKEDLKEIGE
ncbi:hypothetical protein PQE66_gp040 [Bacillus phage PBC2]|uniref:Uncharacterized protein n=1 Tax=Bacillus phage PBC2 TaxID=1675029 RepID=A0A218KBT5_9CAUD|nr:hypothetical protein PQE66_gp040 [Bacillus phage PBC2]AKQ08355.1 hypothetical protein PBC2_040 [Bacillus phage PBC2]